MFLDSEKLSILNDWMYNDFSPTWNQHFKKKDILRTWLSLLQLSILVQKQMAADNAKKAGEHFIVTITQTINRQQ